MTEPPDDLGAKVAVLEEKVKNLEKLADQIESLKWMIIKAAVVVILGTVTGAKALELILGK